MDKPAVQAKEGRKLLSIKISVSMSTKIMAVGLLICIKLLN